MVFRKKFIVQSNDKVCTFHNVTEQAKQTLAESGIRNGIVVVYSHHTTCSVITQECAFDLSMTGLETLQQDLVNVMEDVIPTQRSEGMYLHPGPKALAFAEEHGEDNRGCHNTDVVEDGQMDLGEFGFIYSIDFDQTRARTRTVQIMVIGE